LDNERKTRILLADDHVLFSDCLKIVLEERTTDLKVIATATDGAEAVELCIKLRPDMVLMDVRMPGLDGVQATRQILELYPKTKIIMLTTFDDDDYVRQALKFGACGYLLKNVRPANLVQSIRMVRESIIQLSPEIAGRLLVEVDYPGAPSSGRVFLERLTQREREVLGLLVEAKENLQIADILGISEQTVKNHVHHLYEKLGVSNRLQLIKVLGRSQS